MPSRQHEKTNTKKKNKKCVSTKKGRKTYSKKSYRKAPQAPKRFKSSYIHFSVSRMKRIKEEQEKDKSGSRSKVTINAKIVSDEWKSMSDKERAYWEDIALKDKERFMKEKEAYDGPWHIPNKRRKKDPSAPKRNISAFLSFSQKMRSAVKKENPTMKNTDISKVLAVKWKSAPSEERHPHLLREFNERMKYKTDMARWKRENGETGPLLTHTTNTGSKPNLSGGERWNYSAENYQVNMMSNNINVNLTPPSSHEPPSTKTKSTTFLMTHSVSSHVVEQEMMPSSLCSCTTTSITHHQHQQQQVSPNNFQLVGQGSLSTKVSTQATTTFDGIKHQQYEAPSPMVQCYEKCNAGDGSSNGTTAKNRNTINKEYYYFSSSFDTNNTMTSDMVQNPPPLLAEDFHDPPETTPLGEEFF